VFGGGGGTITHDDQRVMQKRGVDKIFFAGTSLTDMTQWVRDRYAKAGKRAAGSSTEMKLARKLTAMKTATRRENAEEISGWQSEEIARHARDWFYRPGRRGQDDPY